MVFESDSSHFTDIRSSDIDLNSEDCRENLNLEACPIGMVLAKDSGVVDDEGESRLEPYVGLEFDTADDAREFYSVHAMRAGFRIRTGQLYRSRVDGSVSNRRFVCSKEGFQLNSRTGCPAFIRVQKRDSGKWIIDQVHNDHNHELNPVKVLNPLIQQQKTPAALKPMVEAPRRTKIKLLEEIDEGCTINVKRAKRGGGEGVSKLEPYAGLEFNSANEAYKFYHVYASSAGFKIRIGQLFRSKLDGSITSRRFVCSREGFQHPSRVGCGAFMRIKRQVSGRWVVDRQQQDHNHDLEPLMESRSKCYIAPKKLIEETNGGIENDDSVKVICGNAMERHRENNVGSDWYAVLLEYFQTRQAEDTGFFYAVEIDDGRCMNVFWADGRSRFSCSQFGDTVVFDTSYRKSACVVPFATFTGVNHHKQPVLLGCALIADESKESFTWLFETWLKAMSRRQPLSMIADQDEAIQRAIAQVFPGTCHRFSMWQTKVKERQNLTTMDDDFKYEYESCIYQSQTVDEFDAAWATLLNKYGLRENAWLKEMYKKREYWVPLYLRGTFFAGIPLNGNIESFFGSLLNSQTPLTEFVERYEKGLHQRREEERQEDFNTSNFPAFWQTKEPVEEQCRKLYTLAVLKIFQKELQQSYSYIGFKLYEEGIISRYLVRKCGNGNGNENEKYVVTFCASNHNVSCGCLMFEFEGVLCRHILRVLKMLDVREIPSRYILHRWTVNAEHGTVRDVESAGSSQDVMALMKWSLREAASKYTEAGSASLEKYRMTYQIMKEAGKKLYWQIR